MQKNSHGTLEGNSAKRRSHYLIIIMEATQQHHHVDQRPHQQQYPVVMYPIPVNQQQRTVKGPAMYNNLPGIAVRVFSVFNIVLCSISVGLQASSITFSAMYWYYSLDYTGHGFWCGMFYLVAGILGFTTTYRKTRAMVITTLVAAVLAFLAGVTSAVLAVLTNSYYYFYFGNSYQYVEWYGVKWSLMSFAILAAINNLVVLILLSVTLCKKPSTMTNSHGQQPPMPAYYQNMGFTPAMPAAPVMMPANVYSPAPATMMTQHPNNDSSIKVEPIVLNPQQLSKSQEQFNNV